MVEEVIVNSFAHFGDGNSCLLLRKRKYIGEDGITYWEMVFRPNSRIASMYNLKDEINPIDGSVVRNYPATEVKVTDENPNHYRIWVFPDFNGNPTPVSRMDDEKDIQILNLQKIKATLQSEIAELHQMMKSRISPDTFIEHASELIRKARGAATKKTLIDGEEEMENGE